MFNSRKKMYFTISATVSLIMLSIYYGFIVNMNGTYSYLWMINTKIIIYALFYLTLTFLILLFFSDDIFRKWFKKFIIWYAPLSVLLILTGDDGTSYTWLSKADLVNNFGVILVVTTLVFALVQKFVYKSK